MSDWYSELCQALDIKLNALDPKPEIAWENVDFEPSENTTFIAPFMVPADSELVDFDWDQESRGIYQVDVYIPLGQGTSRLRVIVNNIYTLFEGQVLTNGDTEVHIGAITPRYVGREESWYKAQIDIQYRCYAKN
jgi:hypothetical protein